MSKPDGISDEAWAAAEEADRNCQRNSCKDKDCNGFLCADAIRAVILNEREACAKIAEEYAEKCSEAQKQAFDQGNDYNGTMHWSAQNAAFELSQAIRNGRIT